MFSLPQPFLLDYVVNVSVSTLVPGQAIEACGRVQVQIHTFLNSEPDGREYSALRPGRFARDERALDGSQNRSELYEEK
jgi:hypothetical protein